MTNTTPILNDQPIVPFPAPSLTYPLQIPYVECVASATDEDEDWTPAYLIDAIAKSLVNFTYTEITEKKMDHAALEKAWDELSTARREFARKVACWLDREFRFRIRADPSY
jgi:hypothetical protein